MNGKICGTGSSLPVRVVTNEVLAGFVDTNDEWIRERTGIRQRHIISGQESTVSLAVEAAKKALEMSGIDPEEVDMILLSSISSNLILPCGACAVQAQIGASHAVCYDLNAACSGFVFAYNTAQAYIQAGMCRTVLVIGADALTDLTNWKDRSSCILFGDAAGAVVLQAAEEVPFECIMHSDGSKGRAMTCQSRNQAREVPWEDGYMQMDGKEIFKFATTRVPEVLHQLLDKLGMEAQEIDAYILHQANGRILESIARRMGLGLEKFPMNVGECANSSSATVPVLLDQLNHRGELKKGQKIILCGFGAGLSWGATYLEWQMDDAGDASGKGNI